jgi:hypothetical protein
MLQVAVSIQLKDRKTNQIFVDDWTDKALVHLHDDKDTFERHSAGWIADKLHID